ncbi:MAG: hypothetical protein AAGJ35_08015 [Myxococcota bacterium]
MVLGRIGRFLGGVAKGIGKLAQNPLVQIGLNFIPGGQVASLLNTFQNMGGKNILSTALSFLQGNKGKMPLQFIGKALNRSGLAKHFQPGGFIHNARNMLGRVLNFPQTPQFNKVQSNGRKIGNLFDLIERQTNAQRQQRAMEQQMSMGSYMRT